LSKVDLATSLDLFGLKESVGFLPKLKEASLEMASDLPSLQKKFGSLLVVMDGPQQRSPT